MEYSSLEHCIEVWRRVEPTNIAESEEELAILVTIAWLSHQTLVIIHNPESKITIPA